MTDSPLEQINLLDTDYADILVPHRLLKTATSPGFLGVGIFWLTFDWLLVS